MTQSQDMRQPDRREQETEPDYVCSLQGIAVSFGERDVLTGIDLAISGTDRIAVLGDNGSGKSTLMRVIAGNLVPDHGQRKMNAPGAIAYAAQNPRFAQGMSVQQVIDSYHQRFRELETLMRVISNRLNDAPEAEAERLMQQLQKVTDLYEAADGYSLAPRLDSALQQLGLGELDRQRPVAQLSGGQSSRLAMACVLCSGAQLILLDEPTNDLDEAAMNWLERTLEKHRGALVLISHDRMFLKCFARSIVEVSDGQLSHYGNGYDGYLHAKEQERTAIRVAYDNWVQELERSQNLVDRYASRVAAIPRKQEKSSFGHGNFRARDSSHGSTSKIRQAKSRIDELETHRAPQPAAELAFAMPGSTPGQAGGGTLLQVMNAQRSSEPKLSTASFDIKLGERWLVTGPNGAGKSSLLKMLAGELECTEGRIERAANLHCGWLRQEVGILPGDSLIEAFALATGQYVQDAGASLAKLGLFAPQDFLRHPMALSVGQRRRLELAIAVSTKAQMLFLDEPTNHLSPALVEQLEAALVDYPGTVVTVSHDRRWQQKMREHSVVHRLGVKAGRVELIR
ncbi:ABC-F family ATP-binding cassette domain-containing protein [Glutamicibacter sp.]|uniref:ABC-F family ATP-binding cassette domain-containing protein n=1 Tax=Glutamicibacter sp. TaxID=1931995 RepID=UPI003D6AEABD